jgi:positive regulator of sigma E activity
MQADRNFLGASLYQALSTIGAGIGVQLPQKPIIGATWGMIVVALIVVLLSWLAEKLFPKWGLRTLVIFGGVAMAMILIGAISDHANQGSLWPVLLVTAFALYLWQTVILTFDLVFVWHRYIRHWREIGFSKWKPTRAQNST